jgi:phage-related protein
MAVVGEAHIIVRALTDKVSSDIQRGFSGTGAAGRKAGEDMGKAFSRGFNNNVNANVFTKFSDGIRAMVPDAEAARLAFRNLTRTGFSLQVALGSILGAIGALIGGLGALGGAALGAGASLASLGTIFASLGLAMISARLALSGVGRALSALNRQTGGGNAAADAAARVAAANRIADAEQNLAEVIEDNRQNLIDANNEVRDSQLELNDAIKEGQEAIQQLGFDAEEAALAEGRAALELDKARETLARTQDLPPNSRARKEAELAFQEAELRLRQAKDRSSDLNKEQDRLARTGVAGTEAVISANQRLAQAEANKAKVVRDSLRKQADAERELARAREAAASGTGGGGGGSNPFEGLNAAQIEFVKNLQTLKPLIDEIKSSVSAALLPNLWIAISTLAAGLFTTVRDGLTRVATATGLAAIDFANMATEGRNVAALDKLFTNSSTIIGRLGTVAGSAYGIALSLLNAAFPAAERYVNFLDTRLKSFDEYLKSDEGAAATTEFFKLAEDAAAQLGSILDNVLGGIGGIIMANLGPGTGGQIMLDWLEEATGTFRDLKTSGVEGVGSLSDYFVAVAENAKSVLSSIGALITEILKLGANEAIGETFDILKEGAPILGDILEAGAGAGPALANLVVNLLEIGRALADTGALEIFFGTLNTVAGVVADFLSNDVVKAILDVTGRIFAFSLALGTIGQIGSFAFKVIAGNLAALGTAFSVLLKIVSGYYLKKTFFWAKDVAETLYLKALYAKDHAIRIAMWAKEKAVLVADAAVRAGIWLRERAVMVADAAVRAGIWARDLAAMALQKGALIAGAAASGIATAAQWALNAAMSANPIGLIILAIVALIAGLVLLIANWDTVVAFITDTWEGFIGWITPGLEAFGAFFTGMWEAMGQFISDVWNNIVTFVTGAWNAIWGFIQPAIDAFFGWWNGLWTSVGQFISDTWNNIVNFFTTGWQNVWNFILNAIIAYYSWWFSIFAAVGQFISDVWNNIVKFFQDGWNMVWNWILNAVTAYVNWWRGIFEAVGNFISTVWNNIVRFFQDGWRTVYNWIKNAIDNFVTVWRNIFTNVGNFISTVWNNIVGFFKTGWNTVYSWITGAINGFVGFWESAFKGISKFVSDIFGGLVGIMKGPINAIIDLINGMINGLNKIKINVPDWVPLLGGKTISFNVPSIPRLALGGIVSPTPGGTLAQIAEAGQAERVEPLDANGMSKRDKFMVDLIKAQGGTGTINITVNPSAGMDESELASAISREISFQMRRGAVA